jgi:signal transduction histidine kinase
VFQTEALKKKTVTTIYIWSILLVFFFVLLFTVLVIFEGYSDFEKDARALRKQYLAEQERRIRFDTQRVLKYIRHTYAAKPPFLDDEVVKKQVIRAIEQLYGRQDGTGYIFIYDFNGTLLSDPLQINTVSKNLYSFKDENGVQVIKELIDVSRQKEGGFVRYTWIKPTTGKPAPKISYASAFEPWQWMLGTGVYLDEVEKVISQKKEHLKKRLIRYTMGILSLTVILFIISFIGLLIVNGIIRREIDTFSRFFKKAAKTHTRIEKKQIELEEFKKMVKYINEMVDDIHVQQQKLKESNLALENRVEQKTRDIRRKNKQLEKEKRFSESLLIVQDKFIKHSIHEINTPLAVIMMHIDMYKLKYGENKYLSKIEAAAKMISHIYDDLGYMVKKDRFDYTKQRIDFSAFLKERIGFFEEIAKGNEHRIIEEIEEGITVFFSDIQLQRIIDNNLSNAIKYAHRKTDIIIRLNSSDEEIILAFKTNSKQIEDTKRIFEPFHQEVESRGGFGLGLEIVHGICKKNGVQVAVDSGEEITVFRYIFKKYPTDEKGKNDESTTA